MSTPAAEPPVSNLPRVLVVDDSRMVRASIVRHIRTSYDIREEADGEAGWQTLLLDPSIQVVISDLSMPRLDGYGLLARIRSSNLARIREIPVIMISGEEDDASRAKARELGATDFVTKGVGTIELLTRLNSSIKAAQMRRELEESRQALVRPKPVDPKLGLVSKEYLYSHGAQLFSLALRQLGDVSVMVLQLDRYGELTGRHGAQVGELVMRKLARIIAGRVRKEDNVAQTDAARFCVVSPAMNVDAYAAFALRLRAEIETVALSYRGEIIRVTLTIGLANTRDDRAGNIDSLIGLAADRAEQAAAAGGNRVVDGGGQVRKASAGLAMSVDRALVLLQSGSEELVRTHLGDIARQLLPLFELLEKEYRVGIPLAELQQRCGDGRKAEERSQAGITQESEEKKS